ncbi:MAG: signal recognition particle-docking protein FtsY [Candidatus Bathyarchaeia archaeon]
MFEKLRNGLSNLVNKISTMELKPEDLRSILSDFSLVLVENDVALVVAEYICNEIEKRMVGLRVSRFEDRKRLVKEILRTVLLETLEVPNKIDFLEFLEKKRSMRESFIIVFVGINGTGKTTTIAKIANFLLKKKYSVVLAGSDTFRAGAIEQLEEHAKRLGVHMIKHQYGADAAAVAFDAVQYAKSRGINVVLIDTAGRMQTNRNLLMEMEKIIRVVKPDMILFIGDALAGNDAVFQAEEFNKFLNIDGTVLTKLDADAKGGAAISVTYVTKKPIIFVGTGQKYDDLEIFNPETIINRIIN